MAEPRRILVLRLSALGDVIHTLPAVIALRDALPATRIAWVVEKPYAVLVERVAGVEAITVETRRWRKAITSAQTRASVIDAIRAMREFVHGGVAVDFQGLVKSAAFGWLSGASVRYGFARGAIREPAALLLLNRPVPVDRSRHVVDWNMELARAAGAMASHPPALDFSRFLENTAVAREEWHGRIVLIPATGRVSKNWPVANFRELAKQLRERWEVSPLVAWGPGERELAEAITSEGNAEMAPPTTLAELGVLLNRARLVIGGDTGPLHLAAALGTPAIGIFGPTDPRRNGPYGQLQRCVSAFESGGAVDSIGPEAVMRKVEEVVG